MNAGSASLPAASPVTLIGRFVSTLAGSFRSFYLFKHDNKVFDEILQNLSKRFDDLERGNEPLKLEITSRSVLYQGEPIGFREITVHFSAALSALGFKEIILKGPVHRTQFFQLLHILSGKDGDESKREKLMPFITDDDTKPIRLTPRTASVFAGKMPDEAIRARLAPLEKPQSQGGSGFLEALAAAKIQNLPELYAAIERESARLPAITGGFVRAVIDAARDGYFSAERFFALFPLPEPIRDVFSKRLQERSPRRRRMSALGQSFRPSERGRAPQFRGMWVDGLVAFTEAEVTERARRRTEGNPISATGDLQLAESLLKSEGSNFLLGLRFLIRFLGEKNPVAAQESAVKLGAAIWSKNQQGSDDARFMSLLSTLRQNLLTIGNVNLVLFPLREEQIESREFQDTVTYLVSLGKGVMASLIQILEAEQDRGMRKKLCHILTLMARENGPDALIDSAPSASPFLLRNLVMILGDIHSAAAVYTIAPLIDHAQRIVRVESVRSLCKIGTPEAMEALAGAVARLADPESRQLALAAFGEKRTVAAVPALGRLAKDEKTDSALKNLIYTTVGRIGGPAARQVIEAALHETGLLGRFGGDRETQTLLQAILERMSR